MKKKLGNMLILISTAILAIIYGASFMNALCMLGMPDRVGTLIFSASALIAAIWLIGHIWVNSNNSD